MIDLRYWRLAREARNNAVGTKLEYCIRHKDGTWRYLESMAGTIRNEKGEVAKLVLANRDITERKRAEQQAAQVVPRWSDRTVQTAPLPRSPTATVRARPKHPRIPALRIIPRFGRLQGI